jgi:CheY-like chemotaxis protein
MQLAAFGRPFCAQAGRLGSSSSSFQASRVASPSWPLSKAGSWLAAFTPRPQQLLSTLLYIAEGNQFRPSRVMSVGRAEAARWNGNEVVSELPAILIIEDDRDIQAIVEEALADGGFDSAIADSGEEAVALLRSDEVKYRALVTDINLPGRLDGWDIARVAREIDPAFPIVYMTGAGADDWPSKGVPNSILLNKPFAPAQIVTAVSQLLNSGTPQA